ncbi:MAG: hypothetical protein KDA72_00610 [Planctomycetales bacterium]|nr:hypothetical protein [Planctomycetales bacterium]
MAKAGAAAAVSDNIVLADGEPLNLRNRHLAAVLAWLIPGAGHFYQRRYFKSAVFSVCIFSCFILGMLMAGGRCVYASWNETEKRWQYVLQAGIGLPAMPAAIQAWRLRGGERPLWSENFMTAPRSTRDLDDFNRKTASGFDMGTLYTMVAGLLNILVIFDAFAGPLPPPVAKKREREADEEADPGAKPNAAPSASNARAKT